MYNVCANDRRNSVLSFVYHKYNTIISQVIVLMVLILEDCYEDTITKMQKKSEQLDFSCLCYQFFKWF